MKTFWLAAGVAVVALAAAGCRRESGDGQAKAFDANVDPVSAPLTMEPSRDILADQTLISRRAKEGRSAAPAGAPAAGTAASAPAGDANQPPTAGGAEASPIPGDANAAAAPAAGDAPAGGETPAADANVPAPRARGPGPGSSAGPRRGPQPGN